jgi:hypothetical protein
MASRHTWAEVTSFSPREYAFLYDQLHIIAGHEGESSEVLKYRYGDGLLADAVIENRVMEMAELWIDRERQDQERQRNAQARDRNDPWEEDRTREYMSLDKLEQIYGKQRAEAWKQVFRTRTGASGNEEFLVPLDYPGQGYKFDAEGNRIDQGDGSQGMAQGQGDGSQGMDQDQGDESQGMDQCDESQHRCSSFHGPIRKIGADVLTAEAAIRCNGAVSKRPRLAG